MPVIIIFLYNIIDETGSYFEVGFGLLLRLWGTHEILIPEYIGSSIPIDVIIYVLYAFVIGEIIAIFIDEFIQNIAKRRIEITFIKTSDDVGGLENEHVIIKNKGLFPIDMTSWVLLDKGTNKFKFPFFILSGKISLLGKQNTVKVWTKACPDSDEIPDI